MESQLYGRWLVTGGDGFMARALYRRAEREDWSDCKFTAIARDDSRLAAVRQRFRSVSVRRVDVQNRDELEAVMQGHDGVIHLAATKHVDTSEFNVFSTIRNNIIGSENVIRAAIAARVLTVIGVSTDKAAEPANVYGMTKSLMERLFDEAAADYAGAGISFRVARYGNVVASTGSVVPVMVQRLLAGERLRVTDPEMTRFFFPAEQGVDLLLMLANHPSAAASIRPAAADPMQLVVPAMRSIRLHQLVAAVREVAGMAPASDYDVIGARPGEKLHEALLADHERARVIGTVTLGETRAIALTSSRIRPAQPMALPDYFSIGSEQADGIDHDTMVAWIRDALTI